MKHFAFIVTVACCGFGTTTWAGPVDLSKLPPPASKQGVTYEKDIRPLFEASCVRCHGPERPKEGLRLDNLEGVLKGSKAGKVVLPGQSEKSKLMIAVARLDEESAMPPKPRAGRQPGKKGQGEVRTDVHGTNAPAGRSPAGPPPKPLTVEEVGLVRAWIDQGAK